MAAPSLDQLVTQVRLESGLRNNNVITDDQIRTFVGEAYSDLRDRLIVRFASWFRKEVTFTLNGGPDSYIYDLTQLPDFQMVQGLDLLVSPGVYATVPMLASYSERNAFNGTWPFAGTYGYNGSLGRRYFVDGDQLQLLPAQNAAGTYRLVYTPIETMAAPLPLQTVAIQPSDAVFVHNGYYGFDAGNLTVDSSMLGGSFTVDYDAPNDIFNGIYAIATDTEIGSHHVYTTTPFDITKSWTGPASGTFTIGTAAPGTVFVLPDKLVPWQMYLVLFAAIQVRNVREQDSSALAARYLEIKQRVIDLTKQRSEGVRQAPINVNRTGLFGGNGRGWNC